MSLFPNLRGCLARSAFLSALAGCTLTGDEFDPPSIDDAALQASAGVGGSGSGSTSSPGSSGAGQDVSCSSPNELSSCDVELMPSGVALGASCSSDVECDSNACVAGVCARSSAAPECTLDTDCESLVCDGGGCISVSCNDRARNGQEILVDCGGGSCPGCPVGTSCSQGADCSTGVCGAGDTCAAPRCDDAVKNDNETGVDCGGACPDCGTGQPCETAGDCQSGVCVGTGCEAGADRCCQAPRCDDDVRNGDESAPDCGNAACGRCALGTACTANAQCLTGLCQAGTCQQPPCANGERNGAETDTDCGGNDAACARCAVGDDCAGNTDCASGNCIDGACADCDDNRRNGSETGVDCGGVCGPCGPGLGCNVDADCQSNACQEGRCCGGSLVDCTRCARRLSRTLTCDSNGPVATASCVAFLDCLAANPGACPLRYEPGCSDDPGGVCNSARFGGNTGAGVVLADSLLGTAACTFGDDG